MRDELLQRISQQFAGVPRPSMVTKGVARALDEEWSLTERRRTLLYSRDPETDWKQLTNAEIEDYWDIFAFLDGSLRVTTCCAFAGDAGFFAAGVFLGQRSS